MLILEFLKNEGANPMRLGHSNVKNQPENFGSNSVLRFKKLPNNLRLELLMNKI